MSGSAAKLARLKSQGPAWKPASTSARSCWPAAATNLTPRSIDEQIPVPLACRARRGGARRPAVTDLFVAQKLDVAAGVKQQLQADALKRHGIEGAAVAPRAGG